MWFLLLNICFISLASSSPTPSLRVTAFQEDVYASENDTATLVCKVTLSSKQAINYKWQIETYDLQQRTLPDGRPKFKEFHRVDESGKEHYVSLKLNRVRDSDSAAYRCVVQIANTTIKDEAVVTLRRRGELDIPKVPRNVLACCVTEHDTTCDLPTFFQRHHTMTQNALKRRIDCFRRRKLDFQPCCLREKVSLRCMHFCNNSSSNEHIDSCISEEKIYECQQEITSNIPKHLEDFQLSRKNRERFEAKWTEPEHWNGFREFIVYYRKVGTTAWHHTRSNHRVKRMNVVHAEGVYEVAIVVRGKSGFSDPTPMKKVDLQTHD